MDYLWTPWRYQYVTKAGPSQGCVFCLAPQAGDDRGQLIVHRAEFNYIIMNRFPYTSGHLLVVPFAHLASLEPMPEPALTEMMQLARDCEVKLRALYRPDGMNLGMNLGESAGAGIAAHLHLHVLPRWTGDTSFMTVVGETRILPEDLDVTWVRLREAWSAD